MNHHGQFLTKEAGKYAKNAISKGIQKISKNQFVVHEIMFHASKQFLMHTEKKSRFEDISQIIMHYM